MTFGEKLKKYRIEAGMTQQELAHKANISTNTIMNYESGRTYPKKRETYVQLAEILGVNADHLHNENDEFLSDVTAVYGSRGARQANMEPAFIAASCALVTPSRLFCSSTMRCASSLEVKGISVV